MIRSQASTTTSVIDKNKARAAALLQKQEQSVRNSRLTTLLQQQLLPQYGSRTDRAVNNCIKRTIRDYVIDHERFRDEDMAALISNIQQKLKQLSEQQQTEDNHLPASVRDSSPKSSSQRANSSNPAADTEPQDSDSSETVPVKWSVLTALRDIEEETKIEHQKQTQIARRQKFRTDLDTQVEWRRKAEEERKREAERLRAEHNAMFDKQQLEESARQERLQRRAEEEKKVREEQRQLRTEMKEKERQEKLDRDARELEEAKATLAQEEQTRIERMVCV